MKNATVQIWFKKAQDLPTKHGFSLGKAMGFACGCNGVQSSTDNKGKLTLIVTFTDGQTHEFSGVKSFSIG